MSDNHRKLYMAPTHRPAMALRFVERDEMASEDAARKVRVLQQLYVPHNWDTHDEEWRDVPLVVEE